MVSVTSTGARRWVRDTDLDASYSGRMQAPTVAGDLVYAPTKTNIAYLDKGTGLRKALAETNLVQCYDDATWERARGWAAAFAGIALDTPEHGFGALGAHALRELTAT